MGFIIDKIGDLLLASFMYLFQQNAPFTIILLVFGILLFLMWKRYGKAEKWRHKHELAEATFHAQMDHFDDSIPEVGNVFKSNFRKLRKETLISQEVQQKESKLKRQLTHEEYEEIEKLAKQGINNDGEVHRFDLIVDTIQNDLTPIFRRIYKANHLAEKSPTQFEEHINSRISKMHSKFTAILNDKYWEGTEPDRATLYDSQQILIPKIDELLKNILRNGRDIAIEFQKNKEIKKEYFIQEG